MALFGRSDNEFAGDGGDADSGAANPGFLTFGGTRSDTGTGGSDSGDGGSGDFDPVIHIGRDKRNGDGSYRKKRGRKAGGNTSPRGKKADLSTSIDALTRILTVVHVGLAGVTRSPEWKLEQDEAESLAGATANVLSEFDIRPDPKIEAIIGLVTVSGVIYGPRIYLITERKKAETIEQAKRVDEAY